MKVTEVKFTRRYNVGQYEHEEYLVAANLDEGEVASDVLSKLKAEVQAAYAGEQSASEMEDAGQEEEETSEEEKPVKASKKSKVSPTTTPGEESEEEDSGEEEADQEIEDSGDDGETEEEEVETEEVDEVEEEEEKPKAKRGPRTKSKAAKYDRSNETHKKLFAEMLAKMQPKWSKEPRLREAAKKASAKLEGKEFLDKEGELLNDFVTALRKMMK